MYQTFQVPEGDRSFTIEFLKDCCLLFNIDENQARGIRTKNLLGR